MPAPPEERDTDADWRELGASQPYWGVLSDPDFRVENLTPERLQAFYATGRVDIAATLDRLERFTGSRPGGRALDFGCGVGRLAEAMAEHADEVVGYDISPGMLEMARERKGKVTYVDVLPAGSFDWINSYIVFQHIAPERGMGILEDLLSRIAPRGHVSLQLTVWREAHLAWPEPVGWRRLLGREAWRHRWVQSPPVGQILMYDYDLSQVVCLFNRAGFEDLGLASTDHGGHHGVTILGQRRPH